MKKCIKIDCDVLEHYLFDVETVDSSLCAAFRYVLDLTFSSLKKRGGLKDVEEDSSEKNID